MCKAGVSAKFPFNNAEPMPGPARRLKCSQYGASNTELWFPVHCRRLMLGRPAIGASAVLRSCTLDRSLFEAASIDRFFHRLGHTADQTLKEQD
jgi:hypothetical protein